MKKKYIYLLLSVLILTATAGCKKENGDTTVSKSDNPFKTQKESVHEESETKDTENKELAQETETSGQNENNESVPVAESQKIDNLTEEQQQEIASLLDRFIDLEAEDKTLEEQFMLTSSTATKIDLSNQRYELWDQELNAVWELLKVVLDEKEINALLPLQTQWIDSKEAAISQETEEYVKNQTAAELTRQRSYEVATILAEETDTFFVAPMILEEYQGTAMGDFLALKTNLIYDHYTEWTPDKGVVSIDGKELNFLEFCKLANAWDFPVNSDIFLDGYERYGTHFWLFYFDRQPDADMDNRYFIVEKPDGLHITYEFQEWSRSSTDVTKAGLLYSFGSGGAGLSEGDCGYLDQNGDYHLIYSMENASPGWIDSAAERVSDASFGEESTALSEKIDTDLYDCDDFSILFGKMLDQVYCEIVLWNNNFTEYPELLKQYIDATRKDGAIWVSPEEMDSLRNQAIFSAGFTQEDIDVDWMTGRRIK